MNENEMKIGDYLLELAKKTKNFVVLNSGMKKKGGFIDFSRVMEDRYFDFGLGVENMMSAAVGFAVRGKTPVIVAPSILVAGRAWEQIRNDICCSNLNVKIVGMGTGFEACREGAGYQMLEDIALMNVLPNMKLLCPASKNECAGMLDEMMMDFGPTYMRLSLELPEGNEEKYKMAEMKVLKEGTDLALFASGKMVDLCMNVAEVLNASVMVVNVSSLKPINVEKVLECAGKVKHCVTVEDHSVIGGLGAVISGIVPVKRIGVGDKFSESGELSALYRKFKLDFEGIKEQLKSFMNED